jgi:hypothetical protein
MIVHAFLKFLSILCIGIALVAAFSSIRVFISNKNFDSDSSKIYSTLAKYGSIIVAISCAIIICIFAVVSLYVTFIGRI